MAIRTAVVGYGNIGKYAVDAIQAAPIWNWPVLSGVKRRKHQNWLTYRWLRISRSGTKWMWLCCVHPRSVPQYAAEILAKGINTVDSYDIHGKLVDLRRNLTNPPEAQHSRSDFCRMGSGTDSLIRAMLSFMAPKGITYTNFGPGMSIPFCCRKGYRWCRRHLHHRPCRHRRPSAAGVCQLAPGLTLRQWSSKLSMTHTSSMIRPMYTK